jgi:hypothetical protein
LQPGAIISAVCDTSLLGNDQDNIIKIIVDSTLSIDESNEDNNQEEVTIFVSSPEIRSSGGTGESFKETTIIVLGLLIVLISFVLLQLSPGKIRKPYNKRK